MTAAELRAIAPRLCRAWEGLEQARYRAAAGRRFALNRLHKERRVLAHRELQAVRASATRSARYISIRRRKLAASKRAVARWENRLAQANAEVERLGRIAA